VRRTAFVSGVSLALGALVLALLSGQGAAAANRANPRPWTIPALRSWSGGRGVFRLGSAVRIVVPTRYRRTLLPTATLFAADLRALTRRSVGIVTSDAAPRAGEIDLQLGARDGSLRSEGYALGIGASVLITARTPTGVFYGTRTVLQLLKYRPSIPRGQARDWPRYPERGLMIDLGRRSYPASWIEGQIKELAYLKLNLLHLHFTDDQRWGIQSSTHPEIVSRGALTKRQVRDIVALAARYHVIVVPEIDMPGHMGALLAKHPGLELRSPAASSSASGKLDITSPAALALVRRLLEEYMPLFPGPYWDVGADEYLSPGQFGLYPQLGAYAAAHYGPRATAKDAILGFVNGVDAIARRHGKTLRAWHDELGPGGVLKANRDIVAEWWTNVSPLSERRPPTPQQLLAGGHSILNAGWFPAYYTEDVGPIQGKPDMRRAYETWSVNEFCGPTIADHFLAPCYVIPAGDARERGATIDAWDDHELTLDQINAGLAARLRVLAQKTWDSPPLTPSYARFQSILSGARSSAR
jgi:hexosaminidase